MRVIFTGGGTAGHILPNIAILERCKDDVKILYVGEKNGLEETVCFKHHIPFRGIRAGKLRRYFSWQNFADLFKMPIGFFQALSIMREFKPDRVFAKGGYVSVPVGLAAAILRIPLFIHEADVSPGLATKILSPFARKIFLSWDTQSFALRLVVNSFAVRQNTLFSKKYFKKYERKIEVIGMPVRREIFEGSQEKGKKLTGFSSDLPILLVMGGSLGASSLNELLWKILPQLLPLCQIIHITGPDKMTIRFNQHKRYQSFEFVDEELPHLYAIADVIVSRAGASSLAEIIALQKPNILVPLGSHASRGDQILNAEMAEKNGWSFVFHEKKDPPETFFQLIQKLLISKEEQEKMTTAMAQEAHVIRRAAERLAAILKEKL